MMVFYLIHVGSAMLPAIFPVAICALLLAFVMSLILAAKQGVGRLRRLHQIPCNRCAYNTGSPYLRCPVRPLSAFSEDAIHCQDYEPADSRTKTKIRRSAQKMGLSEPLIHAIVLNPDLHSRRS
jgi:hypothetical protein